MFQTCLLLSLIEAFHWICHVDFHWIVSHQCTMYSFKIMTKKKWIEKILLDIVFIRISVWCDYTKCDINVITTEMITTQVQTLRHTVCKISKYQNIELEFEIPKTHHIQYNIIHMWFTIGMWKMLFHWNPTINIQHSTQYMQTHTHT